MININTMDELNRLGFGADVDALESYVAELQESAALGEPMVDDAIYDYHVKLLKELKPKSEVLLRNWEKDVEELTEYDDMLKKYGMCSIETISGLDELTKIKACIRELGGSATIFAGLKENGHAQRSVYLNGYLYNGSTRGQSKKGRDITRHLKAMNPTYVEAWKDIAIVEVRGETLVSKEKYEKYCKPMGLKHPLSSVTSFIKASASDYEISMLESVCYKILSTDDEALGLHTLADEYDMLEECGFRVPEHVVIPAVTEDNLELIAERVLAHFEGLMESDQIKYSADGIVFGLNNRDDFYRLGKQGNAWRGNVAMKFGKYWESNIYSAEILEVVFLPGKVYKVPKAIISPVKTANGAEVTTVPLYNIGVMERFGYTPGSTIYFRFGGEQGVTTCDYLGNSVSSV